MNLEKLKFVLYILFSLFLALIEISLLNASIQHANSVLYYLIWALSLVLVIISMFLLIFNVFIIMKRQVMSGFFRKKYLNTVTIPLLSIILFIIAVSVSQPLFDNMLTGTDFLTRKEATEAKKLGASNRVEYISMKQDIEIREQEQIKKEQEQKQAKEARQKAECIFDPYCYVQSTGMVRTKYACEKAVENLAKYDFKWTDSFSESKFTHIRWYNESQKIVEISGSRAKAQNGFGAYKNIRYTCVYNGDNGNILYATID